MYKFAHKCGRIRSQTFSIYFSASKFQELISAGTMKVLVSNIKLKSRQLL